MLNDDIICGPLLAAAACAAPKRAACARCCDYARERTCSVQGSLHTLHLRVGSVRTRRTTLCAARSDVRFARSCDVHHGSRDSGAARWRCTVLFLRLRANSRVNSQIAHPALGGAAPPSLSQARSRRWRASRAVAQRNAASNKKTRTTGPLLRRAAGGERMQRSHPAPAPTTQPSWHAARVRALTPRCAPARAGWWRA